ncbi:hypothetical protein ACN6MT_03130 [Neobacillus niacini]
MKNKGGHAYHIIKKTKITLFFIFQKGFFILLLPQPLQEAVLIVINWLSD